MHFSARKFIIRAAMVVAVMGMLVVGLESSAPATAGSLDLDAAWRGKVDEQVLEEAVGGESEFLLFMSEQANLSGAADFTTKREKGRYVFETLKAVAVRTQGAILADLSHRGVPHRAYWVANMIWVRGDASLVQTLAQRPDVAHLYANPAVQMDQPDQPASAEASLAPVRIEWNVIKTGAPQVWAAGFTGQGVVIGGQDTGYDWTHPALQSHYRGWDGAMADHNYNWHDAIHEDDPNSFGTNICGFNSSVPCDDHGHGTHTMGTMIGDDGAGNQVGMAPGAQWIACRNMENGWGKPSTYSECYEWFIAPYPVGANSTSGDPTKAPDVINNSWSCPAAEGCTFADILRVVVENVRAAGIVTVHSAGNSGSSCSTVNTPAAIYAASFTVGATDSADNIAGFSSRGPVIVDGSNRLKPDISAPGVSIRSSLPGGYYGTMQGTSMAGPHVAGLVALLLSVRPDQAGQVDWIENAITQNAVPRTTSQTCGGVPGSQVPNNTYGWGRIDAYQTMQSSLLTFSFEITKTAPATVFPGALITYTLVVTHTGVSGPTHNVVVSDTLPDGATFVSASAPYTLTGSTVTWSFSSLEAGQSLSLELVARSPETPGILVNEEYGVRSDEIPFTLGDPVSTRVRGLVEYFMYFPYVPIR